MIIHHVKRFVNGNQSHNQISAFNHLYDDTNFGNPIFWMLSI